MPRNLPKETIQIPTNFALIPTWNKDWLSIALDIVWKGYDRLIKKQKEKHESLKGLNENRITPKLVNHMQVVRDYFPLNVKSLKFHYQYPEWESSITDNPKTPDISFVLGDEEIPVFSLEAKPIERITEKSLEKDYLLGFNKFLNADYAPLREEGGMLGYLQTGTTDEVFDILEKSLSQKLENFNLSKRPHRTSKHKREVKNPLYPIDFVCHHLILEMF